MTILAQTLINDIASELSDVDHVTWSADDLLSYLNAATRRVCLVRPDAKSSVESIQLAAGTKQSLPADARRLIDVTRNMGTDGASPGKVVTAIAQRDLDLYRPTWHSDTKKTYVDHFVYDEETPDTFFVYPPVSSTTNVYVEAKLAKNPTVLTDAATENVDIDDVYEPAIRHWMLHMAYNKETDSQASSMESKFHYQAFNDILGIKSRTDLAFSPSREVKDGKQ